MTDPWRFTAIAHRRHLLLNPLSESVVDRMLDSLAVGPDDRVLDIGCGPAEMLIRLVERRGVCAVGIEPNPYFIDEAKRRAAARGVSGRLELHFGPYEDFHDSAPFAAALCIGSTHACGGYRETLRELVRRVRPGGMIAAGHGYWMRDPDREYLAALEAIPTGREIADVLADAGCRAVLDEIRAEMESHERNLAVMGEAGLTLLGADVAGAEDWEVYEERYARGIEDWVAEHADDADAPLMSRRIAAWRDAVRRWGRDTMGFALYRARVGRPGTPTASRT